MSSLNPNQRIYDVLLEIERGRYRIPDIQRGYEWDKERAANLLDSILNGYPFGAIMVWQPSEEIRDAIQSRDFIKDFDSRADYLSQKAHPATRDAYLVLDGQQRLQSLYIAFFGSFDGARAYIQIDHLPSRVAGDTDYRFEFLAPVAAAKRSNMVSLMDVVKLTPHEKTGYLDKLTNKLCNDVADPADRSRKRADIETNINVVQWAFIGSTALLVQEVDERHDYDNVLEIFHRVNSGGMVLSKSDCASPETQALTAGLGGIPCFARKLASRRGSSTLDI